MDGQRDTAKQATMEGQNVNDINAIGPRIIFKPSILAV